MLKINIVLKGQSISIPENVDPASYYNFKRQRIQFMRIAQ